MKKKNLFIIIGIILCVVLVLTIGTIILFNLIKEKESITASEFKTIMQEKGYDVSDATGYFSQYDYINQAYIAVSDDYSYKIEFYELSNVEYAIGFFNNNKSIFEASKGNFSSETDVNIQNYSKYTLSSNDKYKVISRIDNTVIYLDVDSSNKDTIKDLLDELNY